MAGGRAARAIFGCLWAVTLSGRWPASTGPIRRDDSAADSLRRISGGLKVSAHIAATAIHKRDVLVRKGSRPDAVAPIWRGVSLIPDEVTKAKSGEIVVTAVMLAAYKVTRTSGFARVQVQHQ